MSKLLGFGIASATLFIVLSITPPFSEQSAAPAENPAFVGMGLRLSFLPANNTG
jgi:hypothetical protein